MIIGKGLIASAFNNRVDDLEVLLFASGPSDSKGALESEFNKESKMLLDSITGNPEKLLVYFSTTSILDPDLAGSKYCQHKLQMEQLIKGKANRYLIIRASNVVGKTGNPKTVFNYFKNCIINGVSFELWKNASRNLIDIDDLVKIVLGLIKDEISNVVRTVVNIKSISVLELVKMIEVKLKMRGNYSIVDKGSSFDFSTEIENEKLSDYGVHFGDDYYRNLIEKYV